MTWNTKVLFVYVTAEWTEERPSSNGSSITTTTSNAVVIWDQIITSPSSDYLANLGPASLRKLIKSAEGKTIDPRR